MSEPVGDPPQVTIIVPALNEEPTIREVVERLLALPISCQIIVVNDGSTDKTGEILQQFEHQVLVLKHESPRGKGMAIRSALAHAVGEAVIIQDADLEYAPEQIPEVVGPILAGNAEVVYGDRFHEGLPKGMALPNKVVNRLLAFSVQLLYGKKISDEATCYKAFRTELLQGFDLQCERFEFCPEVTAKALRSGIEIQEVPIKYEPRSMDAGKKIRWTDAPEAFWTLLRYKNWKPETALVVRTATESLSEPK